MLLKIKQLNNIGRFAELRHKADDFKQLALLFARNATGKSTIAAVLRSAAGQQAAPIAERVHKSGEAGPASAELEMEPGGIIAFSGGQWKRTPTPTLVFDQEFIRLNVHVAEEVTRGNKRSMFRIILGPGGMALSQKLDDLKVQGDELVQRRQRAAAAIQRAETSVTDVERFIKAEVPADFEAKMRRAEQAALRVEKSGEIGRTATLGASGISVDESAYAVLLRKTLAGGGSDLEQELARHVKKHSMEDRGRQWLRYGLEHSTTGDCPFCDQPLVSSTIFAALEALLGTQYQAMAGELDAVCACLAPLVGQGAGSLDRILSQNEHLLGFWGRIAELPPLPAFDDVQLANADRVLVDMLAGCEAKQRQPNVPLEITDEQRSEWSWSLQRLREYDAAVERANLIIQALKGGGNLPTSVDVQIAKQNSLKFNALAKRDLEPLKSHVDEWRDANEEHGRIAAVRTETQTALKNYMRETTGTYQSAVNNLLEKFGCNFRLCNTDTNFKGGGKPNADFCINLDGYVVPAGEDGAAPQPSFRTILSGGDKSALALAFFIAQALRRADIADVTIVFDDPFASQDASRQLETILRIRELAKLAKQVVVLSHDPRFLFSIWKDAVGLDMSEHQIGMVGEWRGEIRKWSCEKELEEEYVRRAAKIRAFASTGQHLKGCTDAEVAVQIRPFLEEFMDRRFPGRFARLEMLDTMVKGIADNPDDPLHPHHVKLAELNEFSRPEHHRDPDRQNPTQLRVQCQKVVDIVGRY